MAGSFLRAPLGVLAALAALGVGVTAARADTLLNLVNPPATTGTSYALQLIATDSSTAFVFGGYQVNGNEEVSAISLALAGGGPNLVGPTYTFTPAAHGSFSSTAGGNLFFGAYIAGNYDTYSQNVTTTAGALYTLDFTFTNPPAPYNAPSGLLVTTSGTTVATGTPVAVPEPAGLPVLAVALLGLGALSRRRRA